MDKIQIHEGSYRAGVYPAAQQVSAIAGALTANAKGRSTTMRAQVAAYLKENPIPENGDWLVVVGHGDVFTVGINAGHAPVVSCKVRNWTPHRQRIERAWREICPFIRIYDEMSADVDGEPDLRKLEEETLGPLSKEQCTWTIEGTDIQVHKTSKKLYTFTVFGEKYNFSPSNLPRATTPPGGWPRNMEFAGFVVEERTKSLLLP